MMKKLLGMLLFLAVIGIIVMTVLRHDQYRSLLFTEEPTRVEVAADSLILDTLVQPLPVIIAADTLPLPSVSDSLRVVQ